MMKGVLAGVGAIGLLLGASGVQAVDCSIAKWNEPPEGNAGSLSAGNSSEEIGTTEVRYRRYAGPCGLNVELDGGNAYLLEKDETGFGVPETKFNVRFYFFLDDVNNDVTIFQADDADTDGDSVIKATYDHSAGAMSVEFASSAGAQTVVAENVALEKWNSLEIRWEAAPNEQPQVILGTAEAISTSSSIDTSGLAIDAVKLGAVDSLATSGRINFDDYISTRDGDETKRLVVADANGDGDVNVFDVVAVRNQILGRSDAPGQPDCNEDGAVNVFDVICTSRIILGLDD